MCVKGNLVVEISEGRTLLESGDILIVPPDNWHVFYYNDIPHEAYSFKFNLDVPSRKKFSSSLIDDETFSGIYCDIVHKLLMEEEKSNLFISSKKTVIEYLLKDIVHFRYVSQPAPEAEAEFVRKTRELVYKHGKEVNVAFAAENMGWSAGHLKFMFKKELGISAKDFIDRECLKLSEKHLLYSRLNVSGIAEMMNFPDVYAFSRFYKRMTGKSPSEFRKGSK
jgi:AraC family transcriptional activator of pobA